jgi:Ca2+-binding RTX toxin-like protein
LNAGDTNLASASLSLPGNLAPGTYYLGAYADSGAAVAESNEANNASNVMRVLLGNDNSNTVNGTTGNDIIFGLGGNDTIYGGKGADTLIGGAGADLFVFKATSEGMDRIVDFTQLSDILDFDDKGFGRHLAVGGAATGTLDPLHFALNAPTAATAQFVYNTASHVLYYDADGTGSAAAMAMAQFDDSSLVLKAMDIHLI